MNRKNTNTTPKINAIVTLLVIFVASFLTVLFQTTTPVVAQTCYSESQSIINCPVPSPASQVVGKCYTLYHDQGEYWEETPCPAGGGIDIDGPTEAELMQVELELANEDAEANVKSNPIYELLLTFINFLTAGVGLVVTTLVVVGGLQYMTAGGNPQKTQAAIVRISNALIGLVLYIFMFAILQWLIPGGLFGGGSTNPTDDQNNSQQEMQ